MVKSAMRQILVAGLFFIIGGMSQVVTAYITIIIYDESGDRLYHHTMFHKTDNPQVDGYAPLHHSLMLYDQSGNRVSLHDRIPFITDNPSVSGFSSLHESLVDNSLYDGSGKRFEKSITAIGHNELVICDAQKAGLPIHFSPPERVGDDIFYIGHVLGEDLYVTSDGLASRRPQCCNDLNRGIMMRMDPSAPNEKLTRDLHEHILLAAIYRTGHEGPKKELGGLKLDTYGRVPTQYFDCNIKDKIMQAQYAYSMENFYGTGFRTPNSIGVKGTLFGYQYTLEWFNDLNAVQSQPWNFLGYCPDVPMGYFLNKFKDHDPSQVIRMYREYQFPGFRHYISLLPGYREHIKDCMQKLEKYGFRGVRDRFFAGLTYWNDWYGSFPYHVAEYIRPMYAEILACEAQEVRIAQECAIKKAWKAQKEEENRLLIEERKINATQKKLKNAEHCASDGLRCGEEKSVASQGSFSNPNGKTSTQSDVNVAGTKQELRVDSELKRDDFCVHDNKGQIDFEATYKLQSLFDSMYFMEQAGIDTDSFYDFSGDNDQNDLHERMGNFLLEHAHELIFPEGKEIGPLNHMPYLVFQQGYATSFELNKAELMSEAELMFGISQNIHGILTMGDRFTDTVSNCIVKKFSDPGQACYDLMCKTAQCIVAGNAMVLAAGIVGATAPAIIPAGAVVVSVVSVAQQCLQWRNEWRICAQEIQKELAQFDGRDLTPLEQRYVDTYWEHASSNFVADCAARKLVDLAETQAVSFTASTATALVGQHPKVREMAQSCDELKRSTIQSAKKTYRSVKERAHGAAEWVDRKLEKNPQLEVAGMPGVKIDARAKSQSLATLNESSQQSGGGDSKNVPQGKTKGLGTAPTQWQLEESKIIEVRLLEGTTAGDKTGGWSKIFHTQSHPDFKTATDAAKKQFQSANPTNVRPIPGTGEHGLLPDGRTIIWRNDSSDGAPTLEIQNPDRTKIKIRYTNPESIKKG